MKSHFILLGVLLFFMQSGAQISSSDVDDIAYDEMIRQELPGLAIGVYKKGSIDMLKGYGHIDLNRTKPVTTTTPIRWASISKTLTAVAALQLAERRSDFNINDRVTKHYSHWISKVGLRDVSDKARKSEITIKQLLAHRSGINHYDNGVDFRKNTYKSDADHFNANSSVDVFRDMSLKFDPGNKFEYSTYGYNLLGAVIDQVSGSYPNWVLNSIANKLGMTSLKVSYGTFSGFDKPVDGILKQSSISNKEYVLPGGGWESNVGDLMKFAKGILDGKLLQNTAALWMDDGYKEENGDPQEYRRGVYSAKGINDFRIWHGGAHANLRTNMYIMPDFNIAVVVMIPAEYADAFNVVRKIIDKLGINRGFDTKPDYSCQAGMSSSGKNFIPLLKKSSDEIIIRKGYSTDNFNKEWNFLRSKGYELTDFDCNNNLWDGIFKKMTGQYAMWRNFDQDGFNAKWQEMNSAGYRLYDLETYVIGGKRYWAGLFKKSSGKYAMFRNYSTQAFGDKRDELAKQGYKLIDIEVYTDASGLKWSGVWIEGTDGPLNRNYSFSDFKNLVSTRKSSGYQLVDVETYMDGSSRKWAGIWEKTMVMIASLPNPSNFCNCMNTLEANSKNSWEMIELIEY